MTEAEIENNLVKISVFKSKCRTIINMRSNSGTGYKALVHEHVWNFDVIIWTYISTDTDEMS